MCLLTKILNWTISLPLWQQDACRRLFQKESVLDEIDYEELYALFKKENGIEIEVSHEPVPLSSDHLPSKLPHGESVILLELRDLKNVNLIPSDRILTFSETGITIIYGGNGSGKSGYARVMKKACRARDQSETIHPNASDPDSIDKIPSAKFIIKLMGARHEIEWSCDKLPPEYLSSISVFDSKCARSYITSEQNVAYLPYGLDIIENLANQVLPKLSKMLESEIEKIDVSTQQFEHLIDETKVGKIIGNLSVKSSVGEIISLGTLTEEEINRINELDKVLKESNPLTKIQNLRHSVDRLKAFAAKSNEPLNYVSNEAVNKLKKLNEEKISAEDAENKAADNLRAGEDLLPGTGEQVWKLLFESARRYFTEVAYLGEKFPPSTQNIMCPLCQEKLTISGISRLKRFNEYIKNDIAKTVDIARKNIEIAKDKIMNADLNIITDKVLIDEIKSLDETIYKVISDFEYSVNERRNFMLKGLETSNWTDIPSLNHSPSTRIRQLAARQLKISRTLARAADEEKRKILEKELCELLARQNLAKSLKGVIKLLEQIKRKNSLEKCRLNLKTRSISEKAKEFATISVTEELKKALNEEFIALGIEHIKTKLKEKSVRGKMYHQLLLDLPVTNKIDEILSEGEQRAIALGSFFAELNLSNDSCGIILDDPVSSLDHWRRCNVAKRLVKEAKNRQVIVFTHDTSFIGQLCDEIDVEKIPNLKLFLEWKGGCPGYVNDGLPWDHQGYKERIDTLEKAQKNLEKEWSQYPTENQIGEMRHQYGLLRATLERVIQDVVFNGVVRRYRDWIKVDNLKDVVGFNKSEYDNIQRLHKSCSDVVSAHDASSARDKACPFPKDFLNDIIALKNIIKDVQNRRKIAKKNI